MAADRRVRSAHHLIHETVLPQLRQLAGQVDRLQGLAWRGSTAVDGLRGICEALGAKADAVEAAQKGLAKIEVHTMSSAQACSGT